MEQYRGFLLSTVLIDLLFEVVTDRHNGPPVHRDNGKIGIFLDQITNVGLECIAAVSVYDDQLFQPLPVQGIHDIAQYGFLRFAVRVNAQRQVPLSGVL